MDFLGKLGIDPQLLIAQMINFGLLLWLLSRFIYKPVIKMIEEDEVELEEARKKTGELEIEEKSFTEKKEKEMAQLKKRAREIIIEAEHIAQKIEKGARQKADEEALAIIKQAKSKLESLKPDIEEKVSKEIREKIVGSFKETFSDVFSSSLQKEFQNVFWNDLLEQIEKLTIKKLREPRLAEIVKKLKKAEKEEKGGESDLRRKLENMFAAQIGSVVIEYAHPLTEEQEKELEEIIIKKIGAAIKISKKPNKNLINGFRFEIAGTIIESNLLNIIKDAADLGLHQNKTESISAS